MSAAIDRLHRICHVLHKVASICVRAKAAQQQQDPGQQDHDMLMVGNNIDMYLSQLGFMPQFGGGGVYPQMQPGGVAAANVNDVPGAELNAELQANQLGNWFSANTHIIGLLEEDLSDFEPRGWPSMGDGQ
jgi:hypothetical protein